MRGARTLVSGSEVMLGQERWECECHGRRLARVGAILEVLWRGCPADGFRARVRRHEGLWVEAERAKSRDGRRAAQRAATAQEGVHAGGAQHDLRDGERGVVHVRICTACDRTPDNQISRLHGTYHDGPVFGQPSSASLKQDSHAGPKGGGQPRTQADVGTILAQHGKVGAHKRGCRDASRSSYLWVSSGPASSQQPARGQPKGRWIESQPRTEVGFWMQD
jgi:hypothetical protein